MSVIPTPTWELHLIDIAREAFHTNANVSPVDTDARTLQTAYAMCSDITRRHSKTFFLASSLLPREKRQAARALYAFCRITDDIVDKADDDASITDRLNAWQQAALGLNTTSDDVCLAWSDARAQFDIPSGYANQLIDGVAIDLVRQRYETFDQLAEYAYGVASTVGLMAMHIIGFSHPEAIRYAVKLGVALQLTNILRDVHEDWQQGRLYLPIDELKRFNLDENSIADSLCNDDWFAFMQYQIERNRRLYAESLPGVGLLSADGRLAITAAARLYEGILDDIERREYDVYSGRAHLSNARKLVRLPAIWFQSRFVYNGRNIV